MNNNNESLIRSKTESQLEDWRNQEMKALELLKIVGELRFDRAIDLTLFRKDLYDDRPSEVINDHVFPKHYIGKLLPVSTSLEIAKVIKEMDIYSAKIDIGKLGSEWLNEKDNYKNIKEFVTNKLNGFVGAENEKKDAKDIVLYGFGRIGRLAARVIIGMTGKGEQLRLKAIVIRPKMKNRLEEAIKRGWLLQKDTVHGEFRGTIDVNEDGTELIANGNRIQLIFAKSPEEIDYTKYGIQNALLIDNTGVWRNKAELSVHLRPGISEVMLTAPSDDIPNIVYGANEKDLDLNDTNIFCAASCTTNAIVPVLKVIEDNIGIVKGHIETIHAYTNDQNLLDNFHKKPRRGKGAATNMVITTTGAAKAVSKVIPHLAGKLTGNAVRVPTPDVSIAILNLTLKEATSVEAINNMIRDESLHGKLVEQIRYSTSTEFVSSDAIGSTSTSVLDAPSTIVSEDGKTVTLYAWYDNEFGYTCQVVRLAKYASKVRRKAYY